MSQATREFKDRIRGISQIRKITKAMELVAAAKMRRAVNTALATRAYAVKAYDLLTNLAQVTDSELHPLLSHREPSRRLLILITSDRGLAGGLNSRVIERAEDALSAASALPTDVVTFGKKGEEAMRKSGQRLTATFRHPKGQATYADILPVARIAIDDYEAGAYSQVDVLWTDYRSPLAQDPMAQTLLPIGRAGIRAMIEETGGRRQQLALEESSSTTEYLFEPSPQAVLGAMLRRLVEMQLYQALLEATASEHAARMLAMRNANDASEDLINDLTLEYNQARQAGITQDLAELSASRLALE